MCKKIELNEFKYPYIKFIEPLELKLEFEKINFLYANNGVGKTKLKEYLLDNDKDFCEIQLDNILYEKSNKLLLHKNANEINKKLNSRKQSILKNVNYIYNHISEKKNILSTGSKFYKNNLKQFLNDHSLSTIEKLFIPKTKMEKEIKNSDEYYTYLKKINNFNDSEFIKEVESYDNLWSFFSSVYKEIKNLSLENEIDLQKNCFFENLLIYKQNNENQMELFFSEIKNSCNYAFDFLTKIEEKIKNEVFINIPDKNLYDSKILEEIFLSINNLSDMKNCYICFSKIDNFNEIKKQMKNKLDELEKNTLFSNEEKEILNKCNQIIMKNEDKINLTSFKYNEIKNYKKIISDAFKDYERFLCYQIKCVIDINEDFKDEEKVLNLLYEDAVVKNGDLFNFFKDLINKNINNGLQKRIEVNNNLGNSHNHNFIEIISYSNNNMPFSNGEITLISFIFNLFINQEVNKDKFFIIDDVADSIDKFNRTNIAFIIKEFFKEFETKFFILTHNTNIIKELIDSWKEDFLEKINFMIMYKENDNCQSRNIIQIKNNKELDFFSFKDGIKLLREIIIESLKISSEWSKKNIILFLYISYLLRINYFINKSFYNEADKIFIKILKYEFIFNNEEKNENYFLEAIEYINSKILSKSNCFSNDYNTFNEELIKIRNNYWEEISTLDIGYEIMNENIKQLIKVLFCREELRHLREKNKQIKDQIINHRLNYYLFFLNNYFHNETNPTLILNGIEFNDLFIDNLKIDVEDIKNKLKQ